jgi:hypothetical protein
MIAVAVLVLVACVKDDDPIMGPPVQNPVDASNVPREVFETDGAIQFPERDAGEDARRTPDAVRDAAGPEVARDVGVDVSAPACDLLRQDCPQPGYACYRNPVGGTVCLPSGDLEVGKCAEDDACAPRFACINAGDGTFQCTELCARPIGTCQFNADCLPLAGQTGVGYCEP